MDSTLTNGPGKPQLKLLLAERNQYPDRVAEIDARICTTFQRRAAVLVLDMSGFSRLTIEYGIIHYLAMIEQMDTVSRPAVTANNGHVIKQEADNLFAVFRNPTDAVEAALDILRAFDAVNSVVPDNRDLVGSIGIGYGDLLVIHDEDVFGSEMNIASKLGEDLAERHEILITSAAFEALTPDRFILEPRKYDISGVAIDCHIVVKRARPKKPLPV